MNDHALQEVRDTAKELVRAFGSHDKESYFDFFSKEATFIFYNHPEVLASRQEWFELWETWEKQNNFRIRSCDSHEQRVEMLAPDLAIFSHAVWTSIEMDGRVEAVTERETIVFSRRGGRWVAVHEHLSPHEVL
jgi:ketosteroid isomerase-like protein